MAGAELTVNPISGVVGAEVLGLDVAKDLSDESLAALKRAFLDFGVVFLRDQELSRADQLEFARRFGSPDIHPIADGMADHPEVIRVSKPQGEEASFGTSWHSDNSFFERPSSVTILYGAVIPEYGGDTVWASMERAFDALSPAMKAFLEPLAAVHSASRAYDPGTTGTDKYEGRAAITYTYSDSIYEEVEHPVIRRHPETGRQSIYVNPMFTQRIVGLHADESDAVLQMLYSHSTRPEFTCRFRWHKGSLAIWDNRCLQHYAIDDYRDFERIMYRVTISGDRPRR